MCLWPTIPRREPRRPLTRCWPLLSQQSSSKLQTSTPAINCSRCGPLFVIPSLVVPPTNSRSNTCPWNEPLLLSQQIIGSLWTAERVAACTAAPMFAIVIYTSFSQLFPRKSVYWWIHSLTLLFTVHFRSTPGSSLKLWLNPWPSSCRKATASRLVL